MKDNRMHKGYVFKEYFNLFPGLCPECSLKLNYTNSKAKLFTKSTKQKGKKKRRRSSKGTESRTDSTSKSQAEVNEEAVTNKEIEDIATADKSGNIWKDPVQLADAKSREEEFDEYLDDLFI
jgi:protein FRA10AC1